MVDGQWKRSTLIIIHQTTAITLSQFLFMTIFSQAFFTLVGSHFMAFSFSTARHLHSPFNVF